MKHLKHIDALTEKRVTVKRRYTESHPAVSISTAARVRNAVIEAIGDGVLTEEEMTKILKELKAHKRWLSRNNKLFNISEDETGIKSFRLSVFGTRIKNKTQPVNETNKVNEISGYGKDIWNKYKDDIFAFIKKINKGLFSGEDGALVSNELATIMQDIEKNEMKFDKFINESINEGEILIWNEVEDDFDTLMNKLDDIGSQTTDPKWNKAILSIYNQLDKVSHNLNQYDRKLGAIPTNESVNENKNLTPEVLKQVQDALPALEKLIQKRSGVKAKLTAEFSRHNDIHISSGNLIGQISPMGKTVFKEIQIAFWGGTYQEKENQIWFNPKSGYEHPSGGSNGTDFIWQSLWFKLDDNAWVEGNLVGR